MTVPLGMETPVAAGGGKASAATGPNRYRSGYNLEQRAAEHLRSEGYYVIASRGSHGIVDLVALKPGEVLGVQCKGNGWLSPDEWNELYQLGLELAFVPLLACREKRRLIFYELTGLRVKYSRNPPKRLWTADRVGGVA